MCIKRARGSLPGTTRQEMMEDLNPLPLEAQVRRAAGAGGERLRQIEDENRKLKQIVADELCPDGYGRGVTQDETQAAAYDCIQAEKGNCDAQEDLGSRYAEGRGVPQDNVEAYKWLSLACWEGDEMMFRLCSFWPESCLLNVKERLDAIAEKMTPAEIAEADKRREAWRQAFRLGRAEG
jgi:hypothetical protein